MSRNTQSTIDRFIAGERPGASRLNGLVDPLNDVIRRVNELPPIPGATNFAPVAFQLSESVSGQKAFYRAKECAGLTANPSGDLASTHFIGVSETAHLLAINMAEIDGAGSALSTSDHKTYHGVKYTHIGSESSGTPSMVVVLFWVGSTNDWQQVAITSDGGAAGSDATFPTFTYTFTPSGETTPITGKSPVWRYLAAEHTAGTVGLIVRSGSTWTLWMTDEQPVVAACASSPAFGF